MRFFYECLNYKKDEISVSIQLEDVGQYCCPICDSSYHLNHEEIEIGKTNK